MTDLFQESPPKILKSGDLPTASAVLEFARASVESQILLGRLWCLNVECISLATDTK